MLQIPSLPALNDQSKVHGSARTSLGQPAGVWRDGDHYGDNLGTGEVSPLVPGDTHAGYSLIYSVLI